MPNHAEVAVQAAARVGGVALNYGADSLGSVDVILGRFHDEGVGVDRVAETIFSFGAYVGEVIVRYVGASWVSLAVVPTKVVDTGEPPVTVRG